jgi:iron complex outermembrane receptor protein
VDLGLRGDIRGLNYDLSVFTMRKDNVIFQDADRQMSAAPGPAIRALSSACTGMAAPDGMRVSMAASLATATTVTPICAAVSLEIEGNDIDTAPRRFGSARLGHNRDL